MRDSVETSSSSLDPFERVLDAIQQLRTSNQAYGLVPREVGWQLSHMLRGEHRVFHFGMLISNVGTIGVYVLTPGQVVSAILQHEIREMIGQRMGITQRTVKFFSQEDRPQEDGT